jgi:hypothetical protein
MWVVLQGIFLHSRSFSTKESHQRKVLCVRQNPQTGLTFTFTKQALKMPRRSVQQPLGTGFASAVKIIS